jgi:hypothetical protein
LKSTPVSADFNASNALKLPLDSVDSSDSIAFSHDIIDNVKPNRRIRAEIVETDKIFIIIYVLKFGAAKITVTHPFATLRFINF